MITAPRLSIVITCHTEGRLLLEAVSSAVNQSHHPHETLLVCDGEDHEDTLTACDHAVRTFEVQLIRSPINRGTSAARNIGIRQATGDFIVPLDADDVLPQDSLLSVSQAIKANPSVDFITGPYWLVSTSGDRRLVPTPSVELRRLLAPVPRSF